jgi:nicotinamidase/pyrazinamidase
MSKSALIIVDVQNDFIPGGALAVPEGDKVVPIINRLQPNFDLVVATQDFHPSGHGSFASSHAGKKVGDITRLAGLPQILWPDHCVQGTPGVEFVNELETARFARIFQKGTDPGIDSYSGMYDNGHQKSTGLSEYLKEQGVTDLYLVGLATDYCVKFTALDAVKEGFKVHVIREACRGVNLLPRDVDRSIDQMRKAGVEIV